MTIEMKRSMMDQLRALASERIYSMFGKAPVVVAQYGEYGAYAWCQWPDGVKEHVMIDYLDLLPDGQHDKAMAYIKTIV